MKTVRNFLKICACAGITGVLGCSSFDTLFERVEEPYIRTLDFVYRNAADTTLCEGMPGDTMIMYAYFAGVPVTDIQWEVSWDVYISPYGEDSAYGSMPLEHDEIVPDTAGLTAATQAVGIRFVIPKDIMRTSKSIDKAMFAAMGYDSDQLIDMVEYILKIPNDSLLTNPIYLQFAEMAPLLAQFLTVPVRVFASVNGGTFQIRSDLMVRYNRRFSSIPKVSVNHNPSLKYAGIYKFKENPFPDIGKSSLKKTDSTVVLYSADPGYRTSFGKNFTASETLFVDTGYAWYIFADTGVVNGGDTLDFRDSAVSMLVTDMDQISLTLQNEIYYTQWFFQLDSSETAQVPERDDWFRITNSTSGTDQMLPPLDTAITKATIWVQQYDGFLGERLRRAGSNLREFTVYFKYPADYMERVAEYKKRNGM